MAAFTAALIGLSAVSAGASYVNQRKQAKAVQKAGNYNAAVAETQAQDALTRGREGELSLARDTRGLVGTQQTILAASGVDITSGTAKQLQDEATTLGEFDRLTIRNNAQREAWGYRTQGALNKLATDNEAASLRAGATSTLLTGAANTAGALYGLKSSRARVPVDMGAADRAARIGNRAARKGPTRKGYG